ncbi:MAG: hypothetical protein KY434_06565 [Actinobacteria bacterium]|nr:hypothetical protein [Actinomycetota bacterium]
MGLLAGTAEGLYRLGDGAPERLAGGDVAAMAVDGASVWAVVDATALVRGTADGGFTSVTAHDRPLRSLLPTPDGLLAGTAAAGLVRLSDDRLVPVDGFWAVAGRDDWYTPWGGPADTRSLAAGPDGTLYANVHVGGIARSGDGGATWEPTIDVDADVHQVSVAGGLVLAAAARGLAVSDDRGGSWRWRTGGLHARYARAVAVVGDSVLVSVSEGPGGGRSAVYRGALATDGSWTRCRQGLPEWFTGNVDTGCLVADGGAVAVADAGTVYRSEDGGGTWGVVATDLPTARCLAPLPA